MESVARGVGGAKGVGDAPSVGDAPGEVPAAVPASVPAAVPAAVPASGETKHAQRRALDPGTASGLNSQPSCAPPAPSGSVRSKGVATGDEDGSEEAPSPGLNGCDGRGSSSKRRASRGVTARSGVHERGGPSPSMPCGVDMLGVGIPSGVDGIPPHRCRCGSGPPAGSAPAEASCSAERRSAPPPCEEPGRLRPYPWSGDSAASEGEAMEPLEVSIECSSNDETREVSPREESTDEPGEPCSRGTSRTDGSSTDTGGTSGTGGTRWCAKGGDSIARTGELAAASMRGECSGSESYWSDSASEVATEGGRYGGES